MYIDRRKFKILGLYVSLFFDYRNNSNIPPFLNCQYLPRTTFRYVRGRHEPNRLIMQLKTFSVFCLCIYLFFGCCLFIFGSSCSVGSTSKMHRWAKREGKGGRKGNQTFLILGYNTKLIGPVHFYSKKNANTENSLTQEMINIFFKTSLG